MINMSKTYSNIMFGKVSQELV